MKQYYIVSFGHKQGPYSLDELASQGITPETMIWVVGIPDPCPASEIDELRALLGLPHTEKSSPSSSVEPEATKAAELQPQESDSSKCDIPSIDTAQDRKELSPFTKAVKYFYLSHGVIALTPLIFLISLYPFSLASVSTALLAPMFWGMKSYPQEFITTIGQALYSKSSLEVLIYLAFIAILIYFLILGIRGFQYWQKRKEDLFATVSVVDKSKAISVLGHFIESAGKWYAFYLFALPVGYLLIGYVAFFLIGLAGGANVGTLFFTGVSFILVSAVLPFILSAFLFAFSLVTARVLYMIERLSHDVSDIHRAVVTTQQESTKEERETEKDN